MESTMTQSEEMASRNIRRHKIPASWAGLDRDALIQDASDIGELLARDPDIYVRHWLAAYRRFLIKGNATAPIGSRALLDQLGIIDAVLDLIEATRARVQGRTLPHREVRHPVGIRMKDGRVVQMDRRRKMAA
jgi:hypothetical protein